MQITQVGILGAADSAHSALLLPLPQSCREHQAKSTGPVSTPLPHLLLACAVHPLLMPWCTDLSDAMVCQTGCFLLDCSFSNCCKFRKKDQWDPSDRPASHSLISDFSMECWLSGIQTLHCVWLHLDTRSPPSFVNQYCGPEPPWLLPLQWNCLGLGYLLPRECSPATVISKMVSTTESWN